MSVELSAKRSLRAIRPEHWVFSLDRMLRRWYGVYEFTAHRDCLFRAERCFAEQALLLDDGTRVRRGDPLLRLHLWNEHVPPMGSHGATVAWARRTSRAIETSLRELARHLAQPGEAAAVVAVCADMRLATARQGAQLSRIVGRYGFQNATDSQRERPSRVRLIGENILMVLLVLATNPIALRAGVLRRGYTRVIISRAKLLRGYGPYASSLGPGEAAHAGRRGCRRGPPAAQS